MTSSSPIHHPGFSAQQGFGFSPSSRIAVPLPVLLSSSASRGCSREPGSRNGGTQLLKTDPERGKNPPSFKWGWNGEWRCPAAEDNMRSSLNCFVFSCKHKQLAFLKNVPLFFVFLKSTPFIKSLAYPPLNSGFCNLGVPAAKLFFFNVEEFLIWKKIALQAHSPCLDSYARSDRSHFSSGY